jgi:hypothetical protein
MRECVRGTLAEGKDKTKEDDVRIGKAEMHPDPSLYIENKYVHIHSDWIFKLTTKY